MPLQRACLLVLGEGDVDTGDVDVTVSDPRSSHMIQDSQENGSIGLREEGKSIPGIKNSLNKDLSGQIQVSLQGGQ